MVDKHKFIDPGYSFSYFRHDSLVAELLCSTELEVQNIVSAIDLRAREQWGIMGDSRKIMKLVVSGENLLLISHWKDKTKVEFAVEQL